MAGETERDIRARLTVEKAGDHEAVRELSQDLGDLPAAAESAAAAFERANAAWAHVQQSIEAGSGDVQQQVDALRAAVDDYADAIRAAGEPVTEEQLARIGQLEDAWRQGATAASRYANEQANLREGIEQTTKSAEGQVRPIRSLDDLLDRVGKKWSRYALNVGAAVGTFSAFFEIGTKVRGLLNEITGGAFDRSVQKWAGFDAIARRLSGTLDEAGEAAQRYENNLRFLRNRGIDPTGLSVVEIDRRVQGFGKTMLEERNKAEEAAKAYEEWAESLDLSKEALDKQATALANHARRFAEAHAGLDAADFSDIFGTQLQQVLDQYERLGDRPPEIVADLARQWGVLSSATEEARDRQKVVIDEIRDLLGRTVDDTKQQLDDLAAAIPQALEGIDFNEIRLLDEDQLASARERFQQFLELFRAGNRELTPELAAAATSLGLFVGQAEAAAGAATSFASGAERAADAGTRLVIEIDEEGNAVRRLINDFEAIQPAIAGYTQGQHEIAGASQQAASATNEATTAYRQQTPEVQALLDRWGAGATAATNLAAGQRDAAAATDEAASASSRAAGEAQAVATAAGEQAAAAGDAAAATREMADETSRIGDSQATSGIAALRGEFEATQQAIQILVDLAGQIPGAFRTAGEGSRGWAAPIVAELQSIQSEAEAAFAALQRVAGAEGTALSSSEPLAS